MGHSLPHALALESNGRNPLSLFLCPVGKGHWLFSLAGGTGFPQLSQVHVEGHAPQACCLRTASNRAKSTEDLAKLRGRESIKVDGGCASPPLLLSGNATFFHHHFLPWLVPCHVQ